MAGSYETYVDRPGKPRRYVKNLGWLRKHWQEVTEFKATSDRESFARVVLEATLKDGGTYRVPWASWRFMLEWLNRPIFKGLPITHAGFMAAINVNGVRLNIGSPEYRALYEPGS